LFGFFVLGWLDVLLFLGLLVGFFLVLCVGFVFWFLARFSFNIDRPD